MKTAAVKTPAAGARRQGGIRHVLRSPQRPSWEFRVARLRHLVAGIAIVGIVLPIAITCWHLSDYYGLEHGAGVWISLADWAGRGKLIPPVSFDGYYAGTRYMPLPIMVQSWTADLVGNDVAGGRLVSLGGVLIFLVALFLAFLRAGLPRTPTLVLIAGAMMTPAINVAVVSIRNDALPAGLQVIAVVILADRCLGQRPRMWLLAGSLAGIAVCWKASAVWCIAAAVLCAVSQARRLADLRRHYFFFFVGALGTLAVGAAFSVIMTDGRVISNFRELMFSSEYSAVYLDLWVRPYSTNLIYGMGIAVPLVCYGLFHLVIGRNVPMILKTSVLCCVVLTSLIFVDYQGAYVNHLADLLALGLLGIAYAAGPAWQLLIGRHLTTVLGSAAVLLLVSVIGSWYGPLYNVLRNREVPAYSLGGVDVGPGQILSENPLVNIAIGQRPVVTDPFAFRRIAANNPGYEADLIRRIKRNDFPAVVLLARAGRDSGGWYRVGSWGEGVLAAVCGSYHSAAIIDGGKFEVYLPGKPASLPASSPCHLESLTYD